MADPISSTQVASLMIMPALVCGAIIALYEMILVNRDVQVRTHKMMHMISAGIKALVFTFFCFNVPLLYSLVPQLKTILLLKYEIAVRIAIGIIAAIAVHGSSAAFGGTTGGIRGAKETWAHSFLIGGLIVAAPYVWPIVAPFLPKWLGGGTAVATAVATK